MTCVYVSIVWIGMVLAILAAWPLFKRIPSIHEEEWENR